MISARLFKYWYPDQRKNGTRLFYDWVRQYTDSRQNVLNLGAGPASGNPLKIFRGEVARVIGADIDPVVLDNGEIDEPRVIQGACFPFDDCCFDTVFSDFVLEHVESPEPFLSEVCRVLKPGGSFFFRTPNRYHYVALIARCTPHWFHDMVANRARGLKSDAREPYPTFYRLNSKREILASARKAGFSQVELRHIECEPSYLVFSSIPFLAGVLYERVVNKFDWLSGIRANIFGRMER